MLSNKTKQSCNSPGDLQGQIAVVRTVLQYHCLLVVSLPGLPHKVPKYNLLMSGCTVPEFLFLDCWFCEAVYRGLNCGSSGIKQRRMRELSKPWPLPGSRRGRGPTFGTGPSSIILSFFLLFFLSLSLSAFFGHICVILFSSKSLPMVILPISINISFVLQRRQTIRQSALFLPLVQAYFCLPQPANFYLTLPQW